MQKKIQEFELSAGFFASVSEEILGFQGLFSLRDFKDGNYSTLMG